MKTDPLHNVNAAQNVVLLQNSAPLETIYHRSCTKMCMGTTVKPTARLNSFIVPTGLWDSGVLQFIPNVRNHIPSNQHIQEKNLSKCSQSKSKENQ